MMEKRPGQKDDESAIEYLRRAVEWCNYESETMLESLPSVEAVLDFFDLWSVYGTDFWSGIRECIAEGEDPQPALDFVQKHSLPEGWREDIIEAVRAAKQLAEGAQP